MYNENIVCCYLYVISKYGYPPDADKIEDYIIEMKELGFQSIELEGIRKDNLSELYSMREDLKGILDRHQIRVPYFCTVLPGLASDEQQKRQSNLKLFEKGCEIANLIGADGVLDNAPLPPYHFPEDIPIVRHYDEEVLTKASLPAGFDWADYWQDLIDTYRELCDIAAQYDLTYHMHPCLGVLANNTEGYLYIRDAIDKENLRFNLDTANQFVIKENLPLALHRLKNDIDYIHISDNRGQEVEHLIPGQGNIKWKPFFRTLQEIGFDGNFGLDVGGAESNVGDIEEAYRKSAGWLENQLNSIDKNE